MEQRRKSVLIITEYIAPVQAVASLRWTKLGKYLSRDFGYSVDVLTNSKDFVGTDLFERQYEKDEKLLDDISYFDVVFEVNTPVLLKIVNLIFNLMRLKYRAGSQRKSLGVGQSTGFAKTGGLDFSEAIKSVVVRWRENLTAQMESRSAAKAIMKSGYIDKYDIIISTCGPSWPHRAARLIKERNAPMGWIADFRDSPETALDESKTQVDEFTRSYELADVVTSVSAGVQSDLQVNSDQLAIVLSNGFDRDDMAGVKRASQNKFNIVYTGVLYDSGEQVRDLRPVFSVISNMINNAQIDPADIEFCYAGSSSDLFQEQLADYPRVLERSRDFGLISRRDALKLQSEASILVVATWNTPKLQGVVTGKIWEYLMNGAPVVGTCSGSVPHPQLGEIIKSANAGVMIESCRLEETAPLAQAFIYEKYCEWKETGLTEAQINTDYINNFSYPYLAGQLDRLIENLASVC